MREVGRMDPKMAAQQKTRSFRGGGRPSHHCRRDELAREGSRPIFNVVLPAGARWVLGFCGRYGSRSSLFLINWLIDHFVHLISTINIGAGARRSKGAGGRCCRWGCHTTVDKRRARRVSLLQLSLAASVCTLPLPPQQAGASHGDGTLHRRGARRGQGDGLNLQGIFRGQPQVGKRD